MYKHPGHPAPKSSCISKSVFMPRHPVYLAAFRVLSLKQEWQQAVRALTLDLLGNDVCCVSEARIQEASTVVQRTNHPSLLGSSYTLLVIQRLQRRDVLELVLP
ncbi:hypothetical protein CLF_110690 [Clonorchis sinensis]|uniref:Uncharacterized protein n=1 Tax=Clonorchis sinensis TaxID=79923 RepID=G7YTR9_CLOSI|nr:hypothetical protein CLF_110690 [Clonorchis sinensis]